MNNPHVLGTERVGKLLVQFSIPAIISMTIVSLYNIIDSVFIGHGVGPMAIAGLAITFPMMNLMAAFGNLVAAGGATISSIKLGQKDMQGATDVLGNTLMLCWINAVVFGGVAFLFLDDILRFFGASSETLPYARDFKRDLVLTLFSAEEMGLVGSRLMATMLRDSAVNVGYMVNLEMLGRLKEDNFRMHLFVDDLDAMKQISVPNVDSLSVA